MEVQQPSRISKIRSWYGRYERLISSWSLLCGFVFDAVTLKRVDLFWENFWVIAHIAIVGTCIVLIHAIEREEGAEKNPSKLHFWLVNTQQFFYGGIWSTFLVFYFRSSDILAAWPFLLILALSFWANESLKRSFVRLTFQISLFFLAIFSFFIYLVPVVTHHIGAGIFIVSGITALVFIALFLWLIQIVSQSKQLENRIFLYSSIVGIFALVNVLYFAKFIPPIPLSLKDAGVYYFIDRNTSGQWVATGEQANWTDYFKLYPNFHYLPGQPVMVYSAVFSPPGLNANIVHQWQREENGKWVTVGQIPLRVIGGSDNGYKTYSEKVNNLVPGHWRVNVTTAGGQVIGQIRFNLVQAGALPKIVQQTKI